MSQLRVQLMYRGMTLQADALFESDRNRTDRGFVEHQSPMPVGTELTFCPIDDHTVVTSARVTSVRELPKHCHEGKGQPPGMWLFLGATVPRRDESAAERSDDLPIKSSAVPAADIPSPGAAEDSATNSAPTPPWEEASKRSRRRRRGKR
jgi:hypothetical protein